MTLIIAAHIDDYILIASDRRAMTKNLNGDGLLIIKSNNHHKIREWSYGAIAGAGEVVLLENIKDRVCEQGNKPFDLREIVQHEFNLRLQCGLRIDDIKSSFFISCFNGATAQLAYVDVNESITFESINPINIQMSVFVVTKERLNEAQHFYHQLKKHHEFRSNDEFIAYYTDLLKGFFLKQSQLDNTVTASFDLYLQSCSTGESKLIYIPNEAN